jgi:hypothetical protein
MALLAMSLVVMTSIMDKWTFALAAALHDLKPLKLRDGSSSVEKLWNAAKTRPGAVARAAGNAAKRAPRAKIWMSLLWSQGIQSTTPTTTASLSHRTGLTCLFLGTNQALGRERVHSRGCTLISTGIQWHRKRRRLIPEEMRGSRRSPGPPRLSPPRAPASMTTWPATPTSGADRAGSVEVSVPKSLLPIGYTGSDLACRIGHLVPIWQPLVQCCQSRTPPPQLMFLPCAGMATVSTNTVTDGIHMVLFGMQNRTFGPHLAATNRILIPVVHESWGRALAKCIVGTVPVHGMAAK